MSGSKTIESCGNCRNFLADETAGNKIGFCRGSYPTPIIIGFAQHSITKQQVPLVDSFHPKMPASGWCGQHVPSGRPLVEIDETAFAEALDKARLSQAPTEGTA